MVKIGTHELPYPHTKGLERQVMVTSLFISNQFELVGEVAGTKYLSQRLDLLAQMASSYEETCPVTCYRN